MKKALFFTVFTLFVGLLSAQTVENIQVEQDGEKLNIHYRIGGSTSEQLYFVTLTCSIDNGPVFEPKSVIGDVGANIRGGKSFNTVVWDVFKDVEEVGSVEFFVKVDLESDQAAVSNMPQQNSVRTINGIPVTEVDKIRSTRRTIFIGYGGSLVHPLGVRGGSLGNWGLYGSLRYGGWDDYYYFDDVYNEWWGAYLLSITVGVTKQLVITDKFRLHGMVGLGAGDYVDELELEIGLITVLNNRVNLNLGYSYVSYFSDISFGIGVVF